MANYVATARTNYFKVKDDDKFEADLEGFSLEVGKDNNGNFMLYVEDGDGWGPRWNEKKDEYEDEDIMDVVAKHLVDDWVAIFMESGAEKVRYVSGYAVAVNNKGGRETVSLHNIYPLAATLGTYATEAEY